MHIGHFIFRTVKVLALILISVPVIWICLSLFEAEVVLFQARRIAGDRPYCIVVLDQDRNEVYYKKAAHRSDLAYSSLVTKLAWGGSGAADGMALNYYALLVLQSPDEMQNWSKFYFNFESDVNPLQMSILHTDFGKLCTPLVDFAATIR